MPRLRSAFILFLLTFLPAASHAAPCKPQFEGAFWAEKDLRIVGLNFDRNINALVRDAEGLDAVVLADTSWSMRAEVRGKPRWELAAAAGAEFLKHLRPSDRAAVAGFSAGLGTELAWSASRSAAAESLSRLKKPVYGPLEPGGSYSFVDGGDRVDLRGAEGA